MTPYVIDLMNERKEKDSNNISFFAAQKNLFGHHFNA